MKKAPHRNAVVIGDSAAQNFLFLARKNSYLIIRRIFAGMFHPNCIFTGWCIVWPKSIFPTVAFRTFEKS
jgi:hypothetical protein